MANASSKTPPRFLPTLTEVVKDGTREGARTGAARGAEPTFDAVPTAPTPAARAEASSAKSSKEHSKESSKDSGKDSPNEAFEANISRVLLRLEAPMLARIRLAVAELVDAHIKQLAPLIDQEIETIVREAVREGVTAELVRVRKASAA